MSTILSIIGIIIVAIVGVITLETLSRKSKLRPGVIRKLGHVGLALIISTVAIFLSYKLFILIGLSLAIIALILRQLPLKSLEPFKKDSYGEILFPLGVSLAAVLAYASNFEIITQNQSIISYDTAIFITAVLILGLSDTAAFIAGKNIRSPKILGNKTLAGTIGFVISSVIILGFAMSLSGKVAVDQIFTSIPAILFMSISLSIVELLSDKGSDNITIPIFTAILLIFFGITL